MPRIESEGLVFLLELRHNVRQSLIEFLEQRVERKK